MTASKCIGASRGYIHKLITKYLVQIAISLLGWLTIHTTFMAGSLTPCGSGVFEMVSTYTGKWTNKLEYIFD